jgi:rRNA maturation endonuclease Nob1
VAKLKMKKVRMLELRCGGCGEEILLPASLTIQDNSSIKIDLPGNKWKFCPACGSELVQVRTFRNQLKLPL